jgi:UDP-N-acetylmuramoyl-tripeptide--D-alanyl-D-alanine ligase
MESMLLNEVAAAVGAFVAENPGAGVQITSVCTDTRSLAPGAVFLALRGENSDGHEYVARAFELGAAAAVVERTMKGVAGPQLVVPDSLAALGRLARHYRDRFSIPIVAVTGSVGKTSTRQMVAAALGARFKVLASDKNFNNEIGVPHTLFGLDSSHTAAVIEMGMRGAGQIADLCAIARPTVGLVTNVGLSHIELLGSREGIARAKAELLESVPTDGLAVIPAGDDYAALLREAAGQRPVRTFGVRQTADFRATDITFDADGSSRFLVNGTHFTIHAPGVHHIVNACAASAVSDALGIPLAEVAAQLATFRAPAMRMETTELNESVTVLNDAYNAAPDSMRAALETLALMAAGRRTVAILGDMRELGAWSEGAHSAVGDAAAAQRIGLILTVGEASRGIAEAAADGCGSTVVSFPDTEMAADSIPALLHPGDLVLVKGSRAMEMERIVDAITARFGRSP